MSTNNKAICLINLNLNRSPQLLSHHCLVADLSIFYICFHGHCSQAIRDIIPVPLRRVRTTRSSTHSHPFSVSQPTPKTLSHKSSLIPRMCNLWKMLPSSSFPESCNLLFSNLKSINLPLSLSFLSHQYYSFVRTLHRPPWLQLYTSLKNN